MKAQVADERVTFAADMATFATMNLTYLFYSYTALEVVSGLGNLAGVKSCGSRSLRARRPLSWTSEASTRLCSPT